MKNLPSKIFLQVDADGERPDDFKECHEVCWCSDRVFPTDIEYSLVAEPPADMEDFILWLVGNDEWHLKDKMWHNDGWRSRTTNEMYDLFITEGKLKNKSL